jgi:ring-1,2-phenylacetyl-CoA epoxidase subunit PaaA
MDKVCFEEGFHVKHGEHILAELATGSKTEQEQLQDAFDEWWPRIIQFFGPTNDKSTHHDFSEAVGLKTMTNDELRNAFLNAYIPKARKYGLEIPDEPRIEKQEDGTWTVREDDLDWDEFFTVAKNEYEGGKHQINRRKAAQDAVEWVRDSMEDYGTGTAPQAAD